MSLNYPIQQLALAEFEDMKEEHIQILQELFETELPALIEKYNDRLTAETAKHRTGRPDVLIFSTPLCDYKEIVRGP